MDLIDLLMEKGRFDFTSARPETLFAEMSDNIVEFEEKDDETKEALRKLFYLGMLAGVLAVTRGEKIVIDALYPGSNKASDIMANTISLSYIQGALSKLLGVDGNAKGNQDKPGSEPSCETDRT